MRFLIDGIVLLMVPLACSSVGRTAKAETVVEFVMTTHRSYCGGARPSDEMLEQLAIEKPLADFQFYIKTGKQNDPSVAPIASSITDQDGVALASLPPGTYIVVFEDKVDWGTYGNLKESHRAPTEMFDAVDTLCLNQWIKQPELQFTVESGVPMKLAIKKEEKCFWNAQPCLNYIGSLPY